MRPQYLKIAGKGLHSFSIRHDKLCNFRGAWHYHPELELHYVVKGEGIRFVGDDISKFSEGELVLIGENLPHCWQSDIQSNQQSASSGFEVIVLQFLPACMGTYILNLPEAQSLNWLFERAKKGIIVNGIARAKIINLLRELSTAENIDRLILFFKILRELTENEEQEFITSAKSVHQVRNNSDMDRMNQIHAYSMANYMHKITLKQMADLCNLTVTSFCRFFKTMYRKSYYDFLTDIRISKACTMIIEGDQTIENISNACGYHNMSNFYRHFKSVTRITPFVYKRKFARRSIAA